MIRFPIQQRPEDERVPCPCGECHESVAWGSDLEGGLWIQKHNSAMGIVYGVTHQSGLIVAPTYYRYVQARALQQRLLALPIDWTQGPDVFQQMCEDKTPDFELVRHLLMTWEHLHANWEEEA